MKKGRGTFFKKTLLSVTGLIALFLILVLVNIMVSYANVRWDATEDKSYSLSKGTRIILASMSQPVTVKFFYSGSNPHIPSHIKIYARRVKDFLTEYERESNNMVKLEVIDPRPDSDEEEWAQKYGLQPIQAAGGAPITCGLVFTAADQEETLEWLDPSKEQLLEYDITSIIQGLQNPEKKDSGAHHFPAGVRFRCQSPEARSAPQPPMDICDGNEKNIRCSTNQAFRPFD